MQPEAAVAVVKLSNVCFDYRLLVVRIRDHRGTISSVGKLWANRPDNKKTAADDQPPFPVFFEFCSEGGTRTRDTTIMSRVL